MMSSHRLLAALFVCLSGPTSFASTLFDQGVVTMGHRGTPMLADENTIAAFAVADAYGAHIVEIDPRRTSDGVYVLMHDAKVDRTTNGSGKLADMTFAEVEQLRTRSGQTVPTLERALAFARDHDMGAYLDIKERDDLSQIVDLVAAAGMTDRVLVGCYEMATLRTFEDLEPRLFTVISWPIPAWTLRRAKRSGADGVATLVGLATRSAVRRAHARGLKVVTMPANTERRVQRLRRRGVDIIQSDDPALLRPLGRKKE